MKNRETIVGNTVSTRTRAALLAALTVATVATLTAAPAPAWAADTWSDPHPGIRRLYRTASGPLRIHALVVDLCQPGVSVRATAPDERRRTTSSFGWLVGAEAAINADFFDYSGYQPIGLAMGNGQRWDGTGDSTWQSLVAFGEGRAVFSHDWEWYDPGSRITEVVSGFAQIVRDGNAISDYDCSGHFCARHPRTAVGLSQDRRTLYMLVVDGRSTSSRGVTLAEMAPIMRGLGAWNAVNLDGGGSTTMWVRDLGVVNNPSDGSQRTVANHLAVHADGSGAAPNCPDPCTEAGACAAGSVETQDCGECGQKTRTCNSGCRWDGWSSCSGVASSDACDDGNPCTADRCDVGSAQCVHDPVSANCDDGDACTTGDTCSGGTCSGTPLPGSACDDGNPCTDDVCAPGSGCQSTPNTAPCDDDNACTTGDTCADGRCQGADTWAEDCDDGNPCTDDTCDAVQGCRNTPNAAPCDDGDACTEGDVCADGVCSGRDITATLCNDGDPCTLDGCDPTYGCVWTLIEGACDDGNACTTGDTCRDGLCLGFPLPASACDDGNPCTDDACHPDSGCVHEPNSAFCDDGDACTAPDRCQDGACTSGPRRLCDDGNPCTRDSCQPETGECLTSPRRAPCDDGDPCTLNDICSGGVCEPGDPRLCYDDDPCTDDLCDSATGTCVFPANDASCDDRDPCTLGEHCQGGYCDGGEFICEESTPEDAGGDDTQEGEDAADTPQKPDAQNDNAEAPAQDDVDPAAAPDGAWAAGDEEGASNTGCTVGTTSTPAPLALLLLLALLATTLRRNGAPT